MIPVAAAMHSLLLACECCVSVCVDTRLWRDVTAKLKLHDVEEATEHKHRIEQRQRDDAKRRLETGETWDTRVAVVATLYAPAS